LQGQTQKHNKQAESTKSIKLKRTFYWPKLNIAEHFKAQNLHWWAWSCITHAYNAPQILVMEITKT